MRKVKFIEQEIAEDIKSILRTEVNKIKGKEEVQGNDIVILEKLTKIYSIIMADHRENVKHGVYGDMEDDKLRRLVK